VDPPNYTSSPRPFFFTFYASFELPGYLSPSRRRPPIRCRHRLMLNSSGARADLYSCHGDRAFLNLAVFFSSGAPLMMTHAPPGKLTNARASRVYFSFTGDVLPS